MLKLKNVSHLMSHAALILFAIFASAIPGHAATGDISTVAGDGTYSSLETMGKQP